MFDDDVVLFKPVNRLSGIIPGGNDCNDCMVNNWLLLKWFNSNLRFCVEFINNLLLLFDDEHGIGNVLSINSESRVVLNGKDKQLFFAVSPGLPNNDKQYPLYTLDGFNISNDELKYLLYVCIGLDCNW